ncbi:MAG: hypothetical protein AB3N28_08635 [Kordiimonas sp.]
MANNVGMDLSNGFGEAYPRFFSIFTVIGSALMLSEGGDEASIFLGVLLLGLHGVFTNVRGVGFLRKLLSFLSGAAGALFLFNILMQLLGMSDLVT